MSNNPEIIVDKWLKRINTMEKLHYQAYDYYNNKSLYCLYVIMIILIFTGIYGLLNIYFYFINVFFSILNIMIAFILAYNKFMNWESLAMEHHLKVKSYIKIKNLIELNIVMVSVDREQTMCDMIPEIASLLTKIESEHLRLPEHLKPDIAITQPNIKEESMSNYDNPIEVFNNQSEIKESSLIAIEDISAN